MAKLHKISIQTLRYYDQLGLFRPVYVDQESNYRYYTIDQFSQLDIIKYLKYLGMPLKDQTPHGRQRHTNSQPADWKISVVDEKIRELELIKKSSPPKETLEKGLIPTVSAKSPAVIFRAVIFYR